MATVLSCGACHYPISFRDIAPTRIGETEKEIACPRCGAMYVILIRMTMSPAISEDRVKEVMNRPTT